ncbi:MAG: hypothetical protein ACI4T5_00745 [Prevotella sp.]
MRILHYYTASDKMSKDYIDILSKAMTELNYLSGDSCIENVSASSLHDAIKTIKQANVDIVHLHGCWRDSDFMLVRKAKANGSRIVVSPHGQLEPWIIKQDYWKKHFPRIIAYQKKIVTDAFSVVVMGKMEEECMKRLGWNMRIEIVRNTMITDTITEKEMATKMLYIYNKVMDSHTLALLSYDERKAFAALMKAGVTHDQRWLSDDEKASISSLSPLAWRRIKIHAFHTSLADTLLDAESTLNVSHADIHPEAMPCYLPQADKRRGLFNKEVKPLPAVIADDKGYHTDSLCKFMKVLHKHASTGQLTMKDIVETARQMRRVFVDENAFNEEMKIKGLDKFVASLMQIMHKYTCMEEGFMLAPHKNNSLTKKLSLMIDKELEIT